MPKSSVITPNGYRTHTCEELRARHSGQQVVVSGWVHARRDHGGVIFLDLRDRWGMTQVTINSQKNKQAWHIADTLRNEYVICVEGVVTRRPADMINLKLATGEIEIEGTHLTILSASQTPPFEIGSDADIHEEVRLKYRYLDLRRARPKQNLLLRHHILQSVRTFFYNRDFIEIETPILIKGTPEGAREYIVPSRLHPGQFYVLPQSPQQLKQLSMVAGFDRYMQIARCFRDEDQRGDRQPEFTQVDVEMSFVEEDNILQLTEECLIGLTKQYRPDVTIMQTPFPRLTWDEAMHHYGSDKPDLRYELTFTDITELCKECKFKVFAAAVSEGELVKMLRVPDGATCSRQDLDELTQVALRHGAGGLSWIKVKNDTFEGMPVEKLGRNVVKEIAKAGRAKPGDLLLFSAGPFIKACHSLGAVRVEIARRMNMVNEKQFAYCWVTDFPLFERDENGTLTATHHPFTRPKTEHLELLEQDPLAVRAQAYDSVLNGTEIAGGSLRIHEPELQQKIFSLLNISATEAQQRFGHLLQAFRYGAPPHGGIAWGFDRLVMIFAGEQTIREVIAYPKDQTAKDLMLGAPSSLGTEQLKELHIKLDSSFQ